MQNHNFLMVIPLVVLSFICGCAVIPKPVPYSFAEGESKTAAITFVHNNVRSYIRLLNFDGEKLPPPEKLTRWEPVLFPAGEKLKLKVYIQHDQATTVSSGTVIDIFILAFAMQLNLMEQVYFYCPPLEAGQNYTLSFKSGFATIGRKLVLTEAESGTVIYEQKF